MAIGQAAGTIAGVSIRNGTKPAQTEYEEVRKQLLNDGAKLT